MSEDNTRNSFPGSAVDYHIHIGQFYDEYYQPSAVIRALGICGVKDAWVSSSGSFASWNNEQEKSHVLRYIESEIEEALLAAKEFHMNLVPLYWVIKRRHLEGESIEDVMLNSHYKGFKIHPKDGSWDKEDPTSDRVFDEVCAYASANDLPILIHTGEDLLVLPNRFEEFFSKYPNVKFILAHCKEFEKIIALFLKYENVYGDTAFCPENSYNKICGAGFKSRMQFGTDFPITHWYYRTEDTHEVNERNLTENYKELLSASYYDWE